MNTRQRFKLGAGAGLVTMLLGALMMLAPGAGADQGPADESTTNGAFAAECRTALGLPDDTAIYGAKWGWTGATQAATGPNSATAGFTAQLGWAPIADGDDTGDALDGTMFTFTGASDLVYALVVKQGVEPLDVKTFPGGMSSGSYAYTNDDGNNVFSHVSLCGYVPPVDECPAEPGVQPTGTTCPDVCPAEPGVQPTGTTCPDVCPDEPGTQPTGTTCPSPVPPPPPVTFDACPNLVGDQVAGTDCFPRVVTDVCPEIAGVQQEVDECPAEVLPAVETPPVVTPPGPPAVTPPAPQAKPAAQVLGVQTVRALPRTGDETGTLATAGALMLALGAVMVLGSKRQLARR